MYLSFLLFILGSMTLMTYCMCLLFQSLQHQRHCFEFSLHQFGTSKGRAHALKSRETFKLIEKGVLSVDFPIKVMIICTVCSPCVFCCPAG